jgi:3-hydroxyacyl-CoA dehydrogenase
MTAAAGEVRTDLREDGAMVVTIDNPPANALTPALRGQLLLALVEARSRGARAVVLTGAGHNFSAASTIDSPGGHPSLAEICRAVETLELPVAVVMQGLTVGPGAELALAAHLRLADAGARMVFPEVGLGLVPEAGTTQRLPRLVGAADALELLLKGRPVGAAEALAMGLVDRLHEGPDAVGAAAALALVQPGPRPVSARYDGLRDPAAFNAAVAAARAEAARGVLPAPFHIIDCIAAALVLPFENGLAMEAVAREDLEEGPEAQGLAAAARAERRAAVLPAAVQRVRPKAVQHLGLAGQAPHMAPLALVALGHGLRVTWAEPDAARRAAAVQWVADRQEDEVRAGRLSAVQRDADRARLTDTADPRGLGACDLVVHAAAGAGLAALRRLLPGVPHLVLGGAEGAMGLALAPSARMTELALPDGAAPEQVAVAVQMLRRLALPPVLEGKMPIVGRRVQGAGRAALARLMAMGVPRRVLAQALDEFGHAMPDLPDPETLPAMREMAADEILRRWQGAMANEGLRMLDARVALRPSDIDLVLVAGFGYPRWRGGPMHHAGQRGLMVLRRDLRAWSRDEGAPPIWAPHPLLDRLIAEGRTLAQLDD